MPTEHPLPIAIDDVTAAARRIEGAAVRTPLLENRALNERLGGRLLLKPEILQVTGSFKFRGAYNCISGMSAAERRRGVIAFSSGNHGQGVAAAAYYLACAATIVMPNDAPAVKLDGTRSWGAEVVTYDRAGGADREQIASALAEERGLALVRPFDDPRIMAGQGTAGLEIVEQCSERGIVADHTVCKVVTCALKNNGDGSGDARTVCGRHDRDGWWFVRDTEGA